MLYTIKYALLIICILTSFALKAQTERDLIGTWKVSEVTMDKSSPYADNPMFLKVKATMLKSQFTFRKDHHFIMHTEPKSAPQMPEGLWHYDKEKKLIDVGELAQSDKKLLDFMVSKDAQGNMLFKSVNIPFILKVHK